MVVTSLANASDNRAMHWLYESPVECAEGGEWLIKTQAPAFTYKCVQLVPATTQASKPQRSTRHHKKKARVRGRVYTS
jgi:hypothetical protein